jgi:RNA polymerase-interacting CarD/CdnL/TRCF family regulator
MEKTHEYSRGDWIVHSYYGIGQIKGLDKKDVSGEETQYYRVQATDSTFWIPVDQMDSDVLRPLSTPQEIQQAINVLKTPPQEMSGNYKTRQSRIRSVQILNTPKAIAQLIRDLQARRKKGALNKTERSAFRTLRQRLVEEWAIITGANVEKTASELDRLLSPQKAAANGQSKSVTAQETAAISRTSTPKPRKWGSLWPRRQTNKINR